MTQDGLKTLSMVLALQEAVATLFAEVCRRQQFTDEEARKLLLNVRGSALVAVAGPLTLEPTMSDHLTDQTKECLEVFTAIVASKLRLQLP